MTHHNTLIISRDYPVTKETLFEALANSDAREIWFTGPAGWVQTERSHDFRVGGGEIMRGKFGDFTTSYTSHYYDIVTNQRLVYSFDVVLGGKIYSASLATMMLEPTDDGTRLTLTEQLTYLVNDDPTAAHENRIQGTTIQFDTLAKYLGVETTTPEESPCIEAWEKLK